jgi:hypothetical protein
MRQLCIRMGMDTSCYVRKHLSIHTHTPKHVHVVVRSNHQACRRTHAEPSAGAADDANEWCYGEEDATALPPDPFVQE